MVRLRRSDVHGPGLSRVRRGRGFEYRAPDGSRLDDPALLERLRDLVVPPAWTDVWLSPYANGHILATGMDAAGRRQYMYHPAWQEQMAKEKFERVLQLASVMPAVRRGVTRDLRQEGYERSRVLAGGFRMLDTCFLRVGNEEYAREHGSIGLTTLRNSHATVRSGDTVELAFPGKSGHPWDTAIHDPDLAALISGLKTRGPRVLLLSWRSDGGTWHPIHPTDINADVQERTGGEFTAKDFRTLHGTALAATALARLGVQDSASARKRVIAAAVRETAMQLGNTPAVARASYVDPRVIDLYEHGVVVDPHRSVEPQLVALLT